jgi:4a-hydroxytetrahydrobiopterin dehydratase
MGIKEDIMAPVTARVYTDDEVKNRLYEQLSNWNLEDKAITRTFKTGGWPHTIMLANALAFMAEAAGHHPELSLFYDHLIVRLNTHEPPGITDKDFELAQLMEQQAVWLPADHEALEGYEKTGQGRWIK